MEAFLLFLVAKDLPPPSFSAGSLFFPERAYAPVALHNRFHGSCLKRPLWLLAASIVRPEPVEAFPLTVAGTDLHCLKEKSAEAVTADVGVTV